MKTILAAVDFSDVGDRLVEAAVQYAKAFGATVYLVHVEAPEPDFVGYEGGPQHVRDHVAHIAGAHHEAILRLRERLAALGLEAHGLVIQGPTADKILEEAARINADLIILGSHGHGALLHLLLGSVSTAVLKQAKCPVLVVPSRA